MSTITLQRAPTESEGADKMSRALFEFGLRRSKGENSTAACVAVAEQFAIDPDALRLAMANADAEADCIVDEILAEELARQEASKKPATHTLTARELATVLAGLRYWQREGLTSCGGEHDIATDGGALAPLGSAEIDLLCERLNAPAPAAAQPELASVEEIDAARDEYGSDDVEIDDGARASHTDAGVWVEAWVFVAKGV